MNKFIIKTFGCKTNQIESEYIKELLKKNGYSETSFEKEALELQRLARNVVSNVTTPYQTTASEDFSYYLEKVPGVMMHVGCQQDVYYPQHSEEFCVGENPMLIGTQMFYEIVKHYLI